jgi:hypothetical protein
MSENPTPLYVVCSPRTRVGKTLVSRLLTEFYFIDDRHVAAFDLADEGPQLADYLPEIATVVDISDIRGQVAFFDQLITDTRVAKVIDLSHRAFDNFFAIVREIGFFEEALNHSIDPLILYIVDPRDLNSAETYEMLRDQFSAAASLLPVRNQIEASANPDHDALPNANIAPARLDIPLLNLSLKALVAQQSFSFSRFWRAPPSDLPISMDEELAGWVERVFSQFRNIGLALGWEDPATGLAFRRPSRLPAVRSGPYGDTQAEGIHSLAPPNEDVPEQVLRFAPKKVRNVGSVHPARTALRAAITELEAAKARHNQLLQAEQQAAELDLASARMLAALGEANRATAQHEVEHDKSAATQERRDKGLFLHFEARLAVRQKGRERASATKAAHESLRADLSVAEIAVREGTQRVVTAAADVLVAAAFTQANVLEAAWNNVWRQYDRLSALADCQLRYAESSHRIKLPLEIIKLMEAIAALDRRIFLGGHNDVAARTGELWCRWFEALLTNADAEAIFEPEGYDRH